MFKRLYLICVFSASIAFGACSPKGALTLDLIGKIDYSAIFPLKIAGATIIPGKIPDQTASISGPICKCADPFPRIGIPISFFEPSRIIEVNTDSWCFHTFGFELSSSRIGGGTQGDGQDRQKTFYQAHYLIFPVYAILELLTDYYCMQSTGVDYGYLTEIDPLWNSDTLSAFMQPEALLFGNPVTNLACVADSVAATAFNRPIDALFWCKGSWGNAYPMTGWTNTKNNVEDSASVAASMIYKLHRQLILWGSWGESGLCGYFPAPIWKKSAYRLQLVAPIPSFATSIGTSGLMWTPGHNPPFIGDNFGYMLFKKRDCCFL